MQAKLGFALESMHVVPLDWLWIKLWLTANFKLNQTRWKDFTAVKTCGSGRLSDAIRVSRMLWDRDEKFRAGFGEL